MKQLLVLIASLSWSVAIAQRAVAPQSLPAANTGQTVTQQGPFYLPSYGTQFYAFPGINLFGDSITFGDGASPPALAYGQLILADFGNYGTNFGFSDDMAADMSIKVVTDINPQYTHNPASTMMIGTNDVGNYGSNTNQQDSYIRFVLHSMAWGSIPRVAEVFGTDPQCTLAGTWTLNSGVGFPGGVEQSATNGSTMTCTIVTQGPALYLGYIKDDQTGSGTTTITIDGVAPSNDATVDYFGLGGSAILTNNGSHFGYALNRYTVAPGTHTVVLTVTSATGSATVFPAWLGSAYPISTVSPPIVFFGGVPWQQNNANAALTATYNGFNQADAMEMAADGLPVVFVDERAGGPTGAGFLNSTTDFNAATLPGGVTCPASTAPGLHPNNCGHAHLRDAFEYYMQPIGQPEFTTTSANTDHRGHLTLALGTATYTFSNQFIYQVAPTCVATDTTTLAPVMASATTTVLTLTGTGTDVVNYICVD
jgi:hypothetical protein